jgi:hypothetical protein
MAIFYFHLPSLSSGLEDEMDWSLLININAKLKTGKMLTLDVDNALQGEGLTVGRQFCGAFSRV